MNNILYLRSKHKLYFSSKKVILCKQSFPLYSRMGKYYFIIDSTRIGETATVNQAFILALGKKAGPPPLITLSLVKEIDNYTLEINNVVH